jgi:hypothetical protein
MPHPNPPPHTHTQPLPPTHVHTNNSYTLLSKARIPQTPKAVGACALTRHPSTKTLHALGASIILTSRPPRDLYCPRSRSSIRTLRLVNEAKQGNARPATPRIPWRSLIHHVLLLLLTASVVAASTVVALQLQRHLATATLRLTVMQVAGLPRLCRPRGSRASVGAVGRCWVGRVWEL